tara:strand:- start:4381 stop:5757 length:1377 start_codon:yes stop_codon:yes gene_type:complete
MSPERPEVPEVLGAAGRLLFLIVRGLGMVVSGIPASAAGDAELLRQRSFLNTRPTILPLADLVEGHRRGVVSDAEFENGLSRYGFTERSQQIINSLERPLTSLQELLPLFRRKLISESELETLLDEMGFTATQIEWLKRLAFEVPGIQDVIRFTVREVFDPDLRTALQLDSDFPEGAVEAFEAAGSTEERARDEWAAHWDLPSIQLGFEMLHRKEISEDDIDLILRARDVMPRFRAPIKAVAYRPLTRVDLRRMHALGLLEESELQSGYEDIGFHEVKAALMVEFTKRFNAAPDAESAKDTRDLTRSQIERFFLAGLFTAEESTQQLLDIGFEDEDAATIIRLKQLDQMQDQRDANIRIIRNRFANGVIDFNTAVTDLDGLDLTAVERDLLLTNFESERLSQIRLPSRAELDKFLRKSIIDEDEYIHQLDRLGYPEPWPRRFAAVVLGEENDDEQSDE